MKLRHLLLSAGVAALMAGTVTAQETTGGSDATIGSDGSMATGEVGAAAPAPEFTSLEEMTVGDVLGMNVISPEGDTIGEIDYVIEDADGASAVIGIGGFLGLGEYTVALPLSDFEYDADQRVLTLGTDKETLKEQPEFEESGAESLPDETPVAELIEDEADAAAQEDASDGENMSTDGSDAEGASDDVDTGKDGAVEEDASSSSDMGEDSAAEKKASNADGVTQDSSAQGASGDDSMSEESSSEGDASDDGGAEEETEQKKESEN